MNKTVLTLGSICLFSIHLQYSVAEYDFRPYIDNGHIKTAGHDDAAGVDVADLRVAAYDFGENLTDPYAIADPGFNTEGASSFAPGSGLRLSFRDVDGAFLRYWDGVGSPSFVGTPGDEAIRLAASFTRFAVASEASAVYAPTTDTSLLIGSFTATGSLHAHLGTTLLPDATGPIDPPAGAYLLSFTLSNSGTGVLDSAPLFVVFNNGLSETAVDAAVSAVTADYAAVPEPSTLAVVALAAGALMRRRREEPDEADRRV